MIARGRFCSWLQRLWRDCLGAVAVEYAFIIAFIAIVSAVGMISLGSSLSTFFNFMGTAVNDTACEMPDRASATGKRNSNRCR